MKHIYPTYYNEFSCIADRCPCTCCAGWAIEIDESSLDKYRNMQLQTVDDQEQIFLQDGSAKKRCLNLRSDGLCQLIIDHGEDILCDTCRLFPRHIEEFEGVREYSLSISCPEVARMLLSGNKAIEYMIVEDTDEDAEEYDEFEQDVYKELYALRGQMLKTLQDTQNPLSQRCRMILDAASRLQDDIDDPFGEIDLPDGAYEENADDQSAACMYKTSAEDLYTIMEQWEYTSDQFPELLSKCRSKLFTDTMMFARTDLYQDPLLLLDHPNWQMQFQQIIVYFLHAFFCGSAYDEYYYGMAQLAVGAAIHIALLCEAHRMQYASLTHEDVIRLTYLYARELEHSIPNMLATESWMDEHRL